MSLMQHNHWKQLACFSLALLLGIAALVLITPLIRAKSVATPDPLTISDKAFAEKDHGAEKNSTQPKRAKESLIDWKAWQKINPDLIGWLTIPSLELSLPLVQAHQNDPDYYLDHDVYGNENIYGCPYLDADCIQDGLDSRNAIILGHSLTDGSMFTPLLDYVDESFAQSHREVIVYTPKKTTTYQVRRASIVLGDDLTKCSSFDSEESYFQWLFQEDGRALYTLDTAPATQGISLVTCSYFENPHNERFIIFCTPKAERSTHPTNQAAMELPEYSSPGSGVIKLPETGPAIMKTSSSSE